MLDLIVVPVGGGGHADITLVVLGLLLIVGSVMAYIRLKRQDEAEYASQLKESDRNEQP